MAYMRIRCDYCGGKWEIYHRDNLTDKRARTCPHCGSSIDGQLWEHKVLPTYKAVEETNADLIADHAEYHNPLFQIDFIPDAIFTDRWRNVENG